MKNARNKAALISEIKDQRELMQNDISCIIDGIEGEEKILNMIGDIIVVRFAIILSKIE